MNEPDDEEEEMAKQTSSRDVLTPILRQAFSKLHVLYEKSQKKVLAELIVQLGSTAQFLNSANYSIVLFCALLLLRVVLFIMMIARRLEHTKKNRESARTLPLPPLKFYF